MVWLADAALVLAVWEGLELRSRSARSQVSLQVVKNFTLLKKKEQNAREVGDTNMTISNNNMKPQLCAHTGKPAHTQANKHTHRAHSSPM